jgi:sigma-B regulation protein RsbU (phosphoserine phosphatase)
VISETGAALLADLTAIVMDEMELRFSALGAVCAEQQRRDAERRRADTERAERERADQDKASLARFVTLQQTLLPPALPAVPGLDLACHYHPASPEDVGGISTTCSSSAPAGGAFSWVMCAEGAPRRRR